MIGQVRRDTALYALPVVEVTAGGQRRRSRPRGYGLKYTPERVAALPERRVRLWLYGKRQWVRYRSAQVKARFLKGQVVRVVWVQFEAKDGSLGTTRVLLATAADLRPEVIIKAYARRWPIEPLFNVSYSLKNKDLYHNTMGSVLIPVVLIDRDGFLSR